MLAAGFTVKQVPVASALPTNVVETLKWPCIERHLNYVARCDASIRKFLDPYKKFAFRSTERRFLLCKYTISTVFLRLFR